MSKSYPAELELPDVSVAPHQPVATSFQSNVTVVLVFAVTRKTM
jgi:hypothetical protein